MASETLRQLQIHIRDRYRNMKSGGGVLCISILQLIVGLVLLGIYEGYKVTTQLAQSQLPAATGLERHATGYAADSIFQ